MSKEKKILFSFKIEPSIKKAALEMAEFMDVSLSHVIRDLLKKWIGENEK